MMTPAARSLLSRTGHALDLGRRRSTREAAPGHAAACQASRSRDSRAAWRKPAGLRQPCRSSSRPQLGRQCVPGGTKHPAPRRRRRPRPRAQPARAGVPRVRALKLMQVHGSAFARVPPAEVPVLVGGVAQGVRAALRHRPASLAGPLAEATTPAPGRPAASRSSPISASLRSRSVGAVGPQLGSLGGAVLAWANHDGAARRRRSQRRARRHRVRSRGERGGRPARRRTNARAGSRRTPEAKDARNVQRDRRLRRGSQPPRPQVRAQHRLARIRRGRLKPPRTHARHFATSPSSPTSTTARPRSSTTCSGRPAPSARTRSSPSASWTRTISSASAASRSSRRTRRVRWQGQSRSTSSTRRATPTSAARSSARC